MGDRDEEGRNLVLPYQWAVPQRPMLDRVTVCTTTNSKIETISCAMFHRVPIQEEISENISISVVSAIFVVNAIN